MCSQVLVSKVPSTHTQHYTVNQQSPISQQEELSYQMVPVWLFPDEVTLGGTVVPPENP